MIRGETSSEQYLAQHGKSGGLGCFQVREPTSLRRGDRVVLETFRGLEVGLILCPATIRQARLLGAVSSGAIQRSFSPDDESQSQRLRALGQEIYDESRRLAPSAS